MRCPSARPRARDGPGGNRKRPSWAVAPLAALVAAASAHAQDIEPRTYSNAPVGTNFLIAGYAYARGGLSLDPSLPITDARIDTSTALLAYARAIDFFGKSGKFDAIVPFTRMSGSAQYLAQPVQRTVTGLND